MYDDTGTVLPEINHMRWYFHDLEKEEGGVGVAATLAMASGFDVHVLQLKRTSKKYCLEYGWSKTLNMGGTGSVDTGPDIGVFHGSGSVSHLLLPTDLHITKTSDEVMWIACPTSNGDVYMMNENYMLIVPWLNTTATVTDRYNTLCWRWKKKTALCSSSIGGTIVLGNINDNNIVFCRNRSDNIGILEYIHNDLPLVEKGEEKLEERKEQIVDIEKDLYSTSSSNTLTWEMEAKQLLDTSKY